MNKLLNYIRRLLKVHSPSKKMYGIEKRHIELGKRWIEQYIYKDSLKHHGVKGQKWGVKNGPPYPLRKELNYDKLNKNTIVGHSAPKKKGEKNSIVDHLDSNGVVKTRTFYDADGWKAKEIHTTDHGNPKEHPFGKRGEHFHQYKWDKDTGIMVENEKQEIPENIRRENGDIL